MGKKESVEGKKHKHGADVVGLERLLPLALGKCLSGKKLEDRAVQRVSHPSKAQQKICAYVCGRLGREEGHSVGEGGPAVEQRQKWVKVKNQRGA